MTTIIRNNRGSGHECCPNSNRVRATAGKSARYRPATGKHRDRARKLLATEIAFIPNASFHLGDAHEADGSLASATGIPSAACHRGPDKLPAHLARLCESPLLGAAQEREMFRRMNYLKYRANALRATLDPDEPDVEALAEAERLLDEAQALRDEIVRANARLVMSVVKKFVTARNTFDELLSDGLITLFKAVDKFDYGRGFRFSTYVYRAIASNTYRSLAARANKEIIFIQPVGVKFDIEDQTGSSVARERSWISLSHAMAELLGNLDPRERLIVSQRFAIGRQSPPRTLQSLADELKVSKERVRQLEQRALSKLQGLALERGLDELLDEPSTAQVHAALKGPAHD